MASRNVPNSLQWRSAAPSDAGEWDRFVEGDPAGRLGHVFHFGTVIERTYGFPVVRLIAYRTAVAGDRDDICGVVMGSLVRTPLRRRRLVSMPFHEYGGVLASDHQASVMLATAICCEAGRNGAEEVELRGISPDEHAESSRERGEFVRIPLRDATSMYERVFSSPLRRSLAKARRSAVVVEKLDNWSRIEELFYGLYRRGLRRIGGLPHRVTFFHNMWELLGSRAQFWLASRGGVPLVGMTAYVVGHSIHVVDLVREHDIDQFGAGDAIHWEIMKWGYDHGSRVFDFGPAGSDGIRRYKMKWGGEIVRLDDARLCLSGTAGYRPGSASEASRGSGERAGAGKALRRYVRRALGVLPDPLWVAAGSWARSWTLR